MWYHIGANHSVRVVVNWLFLCSSTKRHYVYNIAKTSSKKHLFHNISMTFHVNPIKQELPWIRVICITSVSLTDSWYSTFVSKLFNSKDYLILGSCILFSFASVFGSSQLNCSWQSLECLVASDTFHFPVMLSFWCSIDRGSTRFLFLPCVPPQSQLKS